MNVKKYLRIYRNTFNTPTFEKPHFKTPPQKNKKRGTPWLDITSKLSAYCEIKNFELKSFTFII